MQQTRKSASNIPFIIILLDSGFNMDKFSVRDVAELLQGEGIPEMILDHFVGKNFVY